MAKIKLDTPLSNIPGIGFALLKRLRQLELETVRDLLLHFPTRYEDYSRIYKIAELEPGQHATIQGVVEDVRMRRSWRRQMTILEAHIADETGTIRAVWFNQPYLKNTLKIGRQANFAGKISLAEHELYLSHPTYELLSQKESVTKHTARLVPVYPETRGLTSKGIRYLIQPILAHLEPLPEFVPPEVLRENDLSELEEAVREIHFPTTLEVATQARRRFAFQDIFLLHLLNLQEKLHLAKQHAPPIPTDTAYLENLLAGLPFTLTASQKHSLKDILNDLAKPHPMNRLLQGDVGSGKTVIAFLAALMAAQNGLQTAIMAPTEVLALQHFETCKKLFEDILRGHPAAPPAVGLLIAKSALLFLGGSLEAKLSISECKKKIASGEIAIIIGTHTLIQKSAVFSNLGLVVIDEQHRFGVRQRAQLAGHHVRKGKLQTIPHFLSMSATPIPRTLMLTIFGDLDISLITELPTGRKRVVTKVVAPEHRHKAYAFIRDEVVRRRHQVFIICPRIGQQTTGEPVQSSRFHARHAAVLETKSVKVEHERLSKEIFPDLRVAMLHGQMKTAEKDAAMQSFRSGESHILVATSVVEVGVDVPNATIMVIEGSDRFGLSQLYQFRGRVGRGRHQSFCLLFTDSDTQDTRRRLTAVVKATSGFELAEQDLALRGPGEFLGSSQTGVPDLAMQTLQDITMIKQSREGAQKILEQDPTLVQHPLLKLKLEQFRKHLHLE